MSKTVVAISFYAAGKNYLLVRGLRTKSVNLEKNYLYNLGLAYEYLNWLHKPKLLSGSYWVDCNDYSITITLKKRKSLAK